MTPHDLLEQILMACRGSDAVSAYDVRSLDLDILRVRVHLIDGTSIDVFYNVATEKTSFALIQDNQRIYGKDNTKMGWHVHPFRSPQSHVPCDPVSFSTFLADVERHRFSDPFGK